VDSMSIWRTSSYSGASGNACVEVASSGTAVLVRDTTNRDGIVLAVNAAAWHHFTASLR
jgi:hypothetical protein